MADAAKLQKLAAARKKLKGYQQEKNKSVKKEEPVSSVVHENVQENENGNHEYFINGQEPKENLEQLDTEPKLPVTSNTVLHASISNIPSTSPSQNDALVQEYGEQNNIDSYNTTQNILQSHEYYNKNHFNEAASQNPYKHQQPQIQTYFNQSASNFFDTVMPNSSQSELDKTMEDPENIPIEALIQKNTEVPLNDQPQPNEVVEEPEDVEVDFSILSTSENLRQLSSQMTQIIEPSYTNHSAISELERRNLELAGLYEKAKLNYEQSNAELVIYKQRIGELEHEIQNVQLSSENRMKLEIGPLQEQLQCHMQTVGILVGEKSELTATLSQTQLAIKDKTDECDELQGRLKTSRSRVADLEKELSSLKEEKLKLSQAGTNFGQIESKLNLQIQQFTDSNGELQQDVAELREKVKKHEEDNRQLLSANKDLNSQLSLAQIKIQQLTAGEAIREDSEVEQLVQDKLALEKQITDLNTSLQRALNDRQQYINQYQQYVVQLNNNVANLGQKLEQTCSENESYAKREQDLVKHIGELEKRLQTLQNEHLNFNSSTSNVKDEETRKELESTKLELLELQQINESLSEKFNDVTSERDELMKELAVSKETLADFEATIERLQGSQTDSTKLLATIESDKVAASRAVQQNTELKRQLEEMQEAFIKMTNDKAELTDKLTTEAYRFNELEEKLKQSEHQLHTLSEAIAIKDKELTEMRNNSVDLNKQVMQQNQLADRLRHYEAHEHSSHSLTSELQNALKQVEMLQDENTRLKEHDNEHHHHHDHDDHHEHDHDVHHQHDSSEVEDTLQKEIFELKQALDQMKIENGELQSKLVSEGKLDMSGVNETNKEMAMRQLENKFMRTMQDIANLQDEKQMLEHIVLQLQGETETIGEYIALYQHQRGVLKQRASEKETQLKQLAKDRELMKQQLGQLNNLINKLVTEKGVSKETLEEHEVLKKQSNDLCEEHAKLHEQMRETQNGTAEKIIALLSEIKTSNLVQPAEVSEAFHPCPWCSGQLITV